MNNFFGKILKSVLVGLGISLLIRAGCAAKPDVTSISEVNASPSSTESVALDCLKSLPDVPTRKDEFSKDLETQADKLEEQGRGQEALSKYSEAHSLHFRELGYATGRAMRGDISASMDLNTSIQSPEFPFKVGRAFAKTEKHEVAIACFTESLDKKIKSPNDASAYLNRGASYIATGNKAKARQDYQKSADLFREYKLPQYEKQATDRLRSIAP